MVKLAEAKKIFNDLYQEVNGYLISSRARKKLPKPDRTLTYGEVTVDTFRKILNKVRPKKGEIFYDLGSGTGKAVILASLFGRFSKLIGIEIIKDLSQAADKVLKDYKRIIKKIDPEKAKQEIIFINNDFFQSDISDADLVFIHSTCFNDILMKKLEEKLFSLKEGARIITVTKRLFSNQFQLLAHGVYRFGWGDGTVYFYKKR